MKISELSIRNFRGIEQVNLFPHQHINLIVGPNASGKSAMLDVIAYLLSWYIARIKNLKGKGMVLIQDDIRINADSCEIFLNTDVAGRWSIVRHLSPSTLEKGSKQDLADMMEHVRSIHNSLDESDPLYSIPVMTYYKANRYVGNTPMKSRKNKSVSVSGTYLDALSIVQLEATGTSDGNNCFQALVNDLRHRLILANPSLENPLEGEGIILIDEVELHLHPKMQMGIISTLKTSFPNCQFFITTNSPLVVSDVHKEQVILLNDGRQCSIGLECYGKMANDILTDYFGIKSPRSMEVQAEIDEAKELLLNHDMIAFEKCLLRLEEMLGKSDIDVIALKLQAGRMGVREE